MIYILKNFLVFQTYRKILGGGVFPLGWGDTGKIQQLLDFHKYMSHRESCQSLVDRNPTVTIDRMQVRIWLHVQFEIVFQRRLIGLYKISSILFNLIFHRPTEIVYYLMGTSLVRLQNTCPDFYLRNRKRADFNYAYQKLGHRLIDRLQFIWLVLVIK